MILLTIGVAHAETAVPPGAITLDTTWTLAGSPYTLAGDVRIEAGATLRLEAGVVVRLGSGANLIVANGGLSALGQIDAPIILTSQFDQPNPTRSPAPGDWGQLRFLPGTSATTTQLENVQVKYGTGIDVQGASPTFNEVQILHHAAPAMQIDLAASPSGRGLSASDNLLNGVKVPAGTITGHVQWRLLGIPYLVERGIVQIGQAAIQLQPTTLDLISLESGPLQITLANLAPAGGLVVDVTSSVPTAATVPATVTIPAGALGAEIPVEAKNEGVTIITASQAGLGTATASVRVKNRPALALSPTTSTFGINQKLPLTVSLPSDAPASGVVVTLLSADPAKVQVPMSALIPAGERSARFEATGVAEGTTTLTATATGYSAASSTLTVRLLSLILPDNLLVQPGGTRLFTIALTDPAPASGLTVTLQISNTGVASAPMTVEALAGATTVNATITGVLAGTTQLTASAPGYRSATTSVQVDRIDIDLQPVGAISLPQGLTQSFQVRLSKPAPAGGATIGLTVANPAVAGVDRAQMVISTGQNVSPGTITVRGLAKGATTLTLSSPGMVEKVININVVDSMQLVFVPREGQNPVVGKGLRTAENTLQIQRLFNGQPTALSNPLQVQVACLAPAVCTTPTTVTIPSGQSSTNLRVMGVGLGQTVLTANAAGYTSANPLPVEVVSPKLNFISLDKLRGVGSDRDEFYLRWAVPGATDATNQTSALDTVVSLSLTDQNPADLVSGFYDAPINGNPIQRVKILVGEQGSSAVYIASPSKQGSYTVTATADNSPTNVSEIQKVTAPFLTLDRHSIVTGKGLTTRFDTFYEATLTVCRALDSKTLPLTVRMSSADPSKVEVPADVEILAGSSCSHFWVRGLESTTDPIAVTASAIGYTSPERPLMVTVLVPEIRFEGLADDRQVTDGRDAFTIRLLVPGVDDPDYAGRRDEASTDLTVSLTITDPEPNAVISGFYDMENGGSTITQTKIGAGSLFTDPVFVSQPTAAGRYSITASIPAIGNVTSTGQAVNYNRIFFTPSSTTMVGKGVREDFVQIQRNPTGPSDLIVSLTSSDPSKVTLPATVTIPAGSSNVGFSITGVGLTAEPVAITAHASGTAPGRLPIRVVLPQLYVDGIKSPRTLGEMRDEIQIRWSIPGSTNPYQTLQEAATVNLTITNSSPAGIVSGFFDAATGNNLITQVPIPLNRYDSAAPVYIAQPTTTGAYTVTASAPGFVLFTSPTVTVEP